MIGGWWALDKDGEPVQVADIGGSSTSGLIEYLKDHPDPFRDPRREVGRERIGPGCIMTDFICLDHNWDPDGEPQYWESMCFGGPMDGEQDRCGGSRADAEAMHREFCQRVRAVPYRFWIIKDFARHQWDLFREDFILFTKPEVPAPDSIEGRLEQHRYRRLYR